MATLTPLQQSVVSALYIALFNRAPDADGFRFWTEGLANGASLTTVVNAFLGSPEARSLYADGLTPTQFVAAFYQTVFGRAADAGGLEFWTGVLSSAAANDPVNARAVLVSKIVEVVSTPLPVKPDGLTDAEYVRTVADRDLFSRKVVTGLDYAVTQHGNDLNTAKQVIANLTAPPQPPGPPPVGRTIRLTTGTDIETGGAGDDTFDASLDGGQQTLQFADRLDGGAGRDTLNVTMNTAYNPPPNGSSMFSPRLSNIEVIRVTGLTGADNKFSLGGASGFTDVGFDSSTMVQTFIGVGNAALSVSNQTVGAAFEGSTATALALTFDHVGAPQTPITVDLASNLFSRGAKATTHNIVATDANVSLIYGKASEAVTTVNIVATGTNKLTLAAADAASVTHLTVTGSGAVDVTGQTLTALRSFTGGSGADSLKLAGAPVQTIDMGAGDDKLEIVQSALSATAKVRLGDGNNTVVVRTASQAGAEIVGGVGNDIFTFAAITHDVTASAGRNEIVDFTAMPGGLAAGASLTVGGLTFTAGGVPLDQAKVATIFASLSENATVGPAAPFGTYTGTFTGYSTSATFGNVVTFTATTLGDKSDLMLSGSGVLAATVMVRTQGADAVTGVVGSREKVTGGGGVNTYNFDAVDVNSKAGAVTAIITDFVVGTDKIAVLQGSAGDANTNFQKAGSTSASLADLLSAADTALNNTITYFVGQVTNGSTYLVTDIDGDGYTNVIELAGGVTLSSFDAADIVARLP